MKKLQWVIENFVLVVSVNWIITLLVDAKSGCNH